MIHNFLFFIYINAEASAFVEYVIFVITVINFARETAAAGKDQLSLSFKRIFPSIALSMITWLLRRIATPLL